MQDVSKQFMLDLAIPVFMFFLTIFLIIFVYIPLKNEIKEVNEQAEAVHKEVLALKAKYSAVTRREPEELNKILKKLTEMVPDYINVAALGKFVNQIATEYGLKIQSLDLLQEQISVDNKDIESLDTTLNVKVIRGPFKLRGTRDDIFRFLDFLVTGPYATEFDAVRIRQASTNGFFWDVYFTAVHYYLPRVSNIDPKTPLVHPDWKVIEEVMGFSMSREITANTTQTPTPQKTNGTNDTKKINKVNK